MTIHIAGETYQPLCGAGSGRECVSSHQAALVAALALGCEVCIQCAMLSVEAEGQG